MPTSNFPLALATLIAVYKVAQVSCGDQCFNIDEIQQSAYFPCNPSVPTSSCCQSDWICLSNGLCEPANNPHPDPVTWTGFCTDPLWGNTTACPKICENDITATGVDNRVSSCGNGHFCCYVDNNSTECCSTSSNVLRLGVATIVTTITVSNSTPATTSLKTSATSGPVITPGLTSQGSSPSVTNVTATNGSNSRVAVGVSVGVGIPVGLAILAGFFYLIRRRSKTRSEGLLEMKHKNDNRPRGQLVKTRLDELPGENPGDLSDPRGPRAELGETSARAEIG